MKKLLALLLLAAPALAQTTVSSSDTFPYVMDTANHTYTLTENITVDGTAFIFAGTADNSTLDLGGYTVTYNAVDAGSRRHGVYTAGSSASGDTPPDAPSGVDGDSGATGWRITNGVIVEYSSAAGDSCHAIFGRAGSGSVVDNLTIRVNTDDTRPIYTNYGRFAVRDCTIYDDGTVVTNRHAIHASIEFDNVADYRIEVLRNTIIGSRQQGIQVRRNTEAVTDSIIVRGNTIYANAATTNDFGIGAALGHLSEIAWNTIKADGGGTVASGGGKGRGIHIASTQNCAVHDNVVDVISATNGEYSRYPTWGIQIEGSPVNVSVYNNDVTVYATIEGDGREVPAGALRLSTGSGISNVAVYDNTFRAFQLDSDEGASYLSEDGCGALNIGTWDAAGDIDIYDNLFVGNQCLVFWDYDIGADAFVIGANSWQFDATTYPIVNSGMRALWAWGGNTGGSTWVVLDGLLDSGQDEQFFNAGSSTGPCVVRGAETVSVGFDGVGSGVTVTATAAAGGLTVQGVTGASGYVDVVLPEWSITYNGSTETTTTHNPWTISAAGQSSYEVSANSFGVIAAASTPDIQSATRSGGNAELTWLSGDGGPYMVWLQASGQDVRALATTDTTATLPMSSAATDVTVKDGTSQRKTSIPE